MLIDSSYLSDNTKKVYSLKERIVREPKYVEKVQLLTLNKNKPYLGLKGDSGLFCSDLWWDNILKGNINTICYKGFICRVFEAGQDKIGKFNTVSIRLIDGSLMDFSIYVNDEKDRVLYKEGFCVYIIKAFDEFKCPPSKNRKYSDITLEVAITYDF